jgi:formate dehydrogenase iron-sulfur subunit
MLPAGSAFAASQPNAMLVDLTKCVGCGWCRDSCKEANHLPLGQIDHTGDDRDHVCLSSTSWTDVDYKEVTDKGVDLRVFVKRQCMHCLSPACVSACPVGALQKQENGPVTYDASRCIGCRYCMVACPFEIPKYQWESTQPSICKCNFCAERQEEGLNPACSDACPTGALSFGNRASLITEAEARLQTNPEKYVEHIYGKDELGGTSWMYLSPTAFDKIGFSEFGTGNVTSLSQTVATVGTAGLAVSMTALLGGLYYVFNKREGVVEEDAIVSDEGEAQS